MVYQGLPELADEDFVFFQKKILLLSGIHLTAGKKDLLRARLTSRLAALELPDISAYRRYLGTLSAQDKEWQRLVNQITTNKTDFFREPAHFKFLTETYLPAWLRRNPRAKLRVWSAACSTGEEPYTLAMVLLHFFKDSSRFEIFASDIDTKVLAQAKNAVYPRHRLQEIPPSYHESGVIQGRGDVSNWFKIREPMQATVSFGRVNLIEADFQRHGKFDIIFCRNVFIYFQMDTIEKILSGFSQSLNPDGHLFLGHSESLRMDPKAWSTLGPSIYQKGAKSSEKDKTPATTSSLAAPSPSRKLPSSTQNQKMRVLVAAQPGIRRGICRSIEASSQLELCASPSGQKSEIEEAIRRDKPDVIALDLSLLNREGTETLLFQYPIPVIVVGSVQADGGEGVMQALEMGAVDYVRLADESDYQGLAERCLAAASSKVRRTRQRAPRKETAPKLAISGQQKWPTIAIGASTGGVQALTEILQQLPAAIPPIVIVQHIPAKFSATFAERLNGICPFVVKEAADGDLIVDGQVLIAPGAHHMRVEPSNRGFIVRISDGPAVNRHKPSVDVLFESVAKHLGSRAIGAILTGMGNDGAKGLKMMRDKGALTVAQDEATSAVFGMPKEAIRLGAAGEVCSLEQMPQVLMRLINRMAELKRA